MKAFLLFLIFITTFFTSCINILEYNTQREEIFVLKCAMQGGKVEYTEDKQVCLVHEAIKGEFK